MRHHPHHHWCYYHPDSPLCPQPDDDGDDDADTGFGALWDDVQNQLQALANGTLDMDGLQDEVAGLPRQHPARRHFEDFRHHWNQLRRHVYR